MIMKCPLGIYFRSNYVLRCFTVLLRRCTESYLLIVGIIKTFVCVSQFLKVSNGLIMRGKKNKIKVSLFHLDELSKYYFSRSFVALEIKNLEFISTKYSCTLFITV